VLMWQSNHHRLLYWNRFGMPGTVLDKYNREESIPVYWWLDAKKASTLKEAIASKKVLPKPEYDVFYKE
ncbi:MAG TPA: ABC transporter substrate-binding protein, partial [Fibrobacteraceae bacterium]|nr:ABC transporter substrate-binding protein [Fibrobacteraceae bacterium]